MAGRPRTRAKKEAAARAAAGLPPAPVMFVDGAPPSATVPTVDAILGRPEKRLAYTAELGARVCELIALRVPLSAICDQPWAPCERTVYAWRRAHEAFDHAITVARTHRAEARTDAIDQVIDDVRSGKLDPIAARVVFDAEKWLASRENAGRYADNSTQRIELTGRDGGPVNILTNDDPVQVREMARFYSLIFAKGAEATRRIELEASEFEETPALEMANG